MNVRVDRADGSGTDVNVSNDLGLAKTGTVLRLDGDIRIAKWFSVALNYYGFSRSESQVIDKDIQIGDTLYPVKQTLKTTLNTTFANLDLKFYLIHRERLDFGVYAGVYLTHFKINVQAQELDRQLIQIKKLWAPIPSVGLHFWYEPVPKLFVYAKAGYFKFSPTKHSKFESATFNINLEYYFWKFLGIGARYEYNRFNLDLDVAKYLGMLKYRVDGAQAYLTIGF